MAKSKASKEPPKVKEEEQAVECEVDSPPQPEEEPANAPVVQAPPVVVETPIEAHLAQIVIEQYEDEDSDPLFTGFRTIHYRGGHVYTGDFTNGKMHGEGEYTWNHGLKYKGDFKENVICGKGSYEWPDGSIYKGEVDNGLRHGKGTFYCYNNPSIYSGDWVYGKRTGTGKITYDKDKYSYYVGEWNDNKKCGQGFRQYPSGSTYDGEWQDNCRHGQGTMNWDGELYTGEWFMGIQHGNGKHQWMVDSSSQHPLKNEYVGQWNNGQRHGCGVFTYASGARYEGEWIENVKHGYGKFFFKDGTIFSGNFDKDSIVGRPGSPDMGKLMRSAVVTGRVSSPLHKHTKSSQSSFQLDIKRLVDDEIYTEEELQQVHNVLLRHITEIRSIYNTYCRLGDVDSGALLRMEFWKFLKDSEIYLQISMPEADMVISDAMEIECETERQSPFTRFLFREFLQALVYLSVYIYSNKIERENGSFVAKCLSTLLQQHILSVDPGSSGYSHSHPKNKHYVGKCWKIYKHLLQRNNNIFTLRDILFVLKDVKLITRTKSRLNVVTVVEDIMLSVNKNMKNDGALFLDVRINFYDFFNVLCGCALIINQPAPHQSNAHSGGGTATDTDTEMSGGHDSVSAEKTPVPRSESPTKSLSKKSPTDTPLQEASTPIAGSVLSDVDSLTPSQEQVERCETTGGWNWVQSADNDYLASFFLQDFFPGADRLIEIEKRILREKEKKEEERAAAQAAALRDNTDVDIPSELEAALLGSTQGELAETPAENTTPLVAASN